MKSSQNCKGRSLAAILAAGAVGLATCLAAPVAGADTSGATQQYQPWAGAAAAQQLKDMIAELKAKIAAAEKYHAASPDFITDLKALVAKYEGLQAAAASPAPTGPAPGTEIFVDTFADGDFTSNPTWKVSAGTWRIDPSGTNRGLVSRIRPQKLNIDNVLGALLDSQSGSTSEKQFASIYTPVKIPNAFALKVVLTSRDRQGALNLGVYQGTSGSTLYRMVYQPGATPGLAIQKVTPSGVTTLGGYNSIVNLEDSKPHTLVFNRDAEGNMKITLDNQTTATAKDTSIKGDMTGLLFINSGGSYYIREARVITN